LVNNKTLQVLEAHNKPEVYLVKNHSKAQVSAVLVASEANLNNLKHLQESSDSQHQQWAGHQQVSLDSQHSLQQWEEVLDKTRHNQLKLLQGSSVVLLKESVVWANQLRLAPLDNSLLWEVCPVVHLLSDSLPKAVVFLAVVHNIQLNLKACLAHNKTRNKAHSLVGLKVVLEELRLSLASVALTSQRVRSQEDSLANLNHRLDCLVSLPNLKLKSHSVNSSLPQVVLWVKQQEFSLKMARATQQTSMVKLATTLSKQARLADNSLRKLIKPKIMIRICQCFTSLILG
jgi:hypothetical protein